MRIIRRSRRRAGPRPQRPQPLPVGAPAPGISGESPAGGPVEVAVADGAAILVFLTTDCQECLGLWRGMTPRPASGHAPVVLVTPDPSTQSRRALEALVPAGRVAVMSSDSWHRYGVTKAPWCVVVVGGRVVASEPGGSDWGDVVAWAGAAVGGSPERDG